jgi:hypothetical protein
MSVENKIDLDGVFERKKAALYALCLEYAGSVLAEFRARQPVSTFDSSFLAKYSSANVGYFWTNRTGTAAAEVFSDAFLGDDAMGWFLAHGVDYGVYLELANDRRHAALQPLVAEFYPKFLSQAQALYAD